MNKIIRGKRYNTETAQLIGTYEANEPIDSDSWFREELYQKRTGEFFMFGQGGADTQYCIFSKDGKCKAGQTLEPLDTAEAEVWCEEHLTGDEYEAIFGEVEEDGSRSTTCITLPNSLLNTLKSEAQEKDVTFSKYIEKIIVKGMNEK